MRLTASSATWVAADALTFVVSAILTRGACDPASFAFDDAAESIGGVAGREVFGSLQLAHFDLAVSVAERRWEAAAAADAPAVAAGAQDGAVKQHAGFGQLLVVGDHLVQKFGSATGARSASLSALARTMIMNLVATGSAAAGKRAAELHDVPQTPTSTTAPENFSAPACQ